MEFFLGQAMQTNTANNAFHEEPRRQDSTPEALKVIESLRADIPAGLRILLSKDKAATALQECATLPLDDRLNKVLSAKSVSTLWGSLLHPPLSYRGDKFQYRSADGGDNSYLLPHLGKAGLPYAKSVQGEKAMHGAKPDPGDIFDLLLAREDADTCEETDLGLSSMLLYHAIIIIHDVFRSNMEDKNISDTSSYLDLAPLYGRDREHQMMVRTRENGLLKPDSFAEDRLLSQPPGVCIYLLLYNRFHNYVAKQLLEINENGKFSLPSKWKWDTMTEIERQAAKDMLDEDLFQTARLITCGLYINISIHDYLRVLMLLHTKDTPWTLDPRIEIPEVDNKEGIRRGIGNQVSVEFNLVYRFHSPISRRDAKWTEDFFRASFPPFVKQGLLTQKQLDDLDIPVEIMNAAIEMGHKRTLPPREKAQLAYMPEGLGFRKIGEDGRPVSDFQFKRDPVTHLFDSKELAQHLAESIEDPICHFGARNTPKALRSIEILGILQARKWEVATLNEFRNFFGLPRHKRFEDINSDPTIQDALRDLYDDPDMVELYPGIFCEGQGRNLDPGAKCPNDEVTALWRGVFSDAVTLVRSDRFYTIDWNVGSLTGWGMREVTPNPSILKGSVIHRLFQRALPGYFEYNSVHLWQPFHTPAKNVLLAKEQGYLPDLQPLSDLGIHTNDVYNANFEELKKMVKMRDFSRPAQPIEVTSYDTIQSDIYGKLKDQFVYPAILDSDSIPKGPLRDIMTGERRLVAEAITIFEDAIQENEKAMFLQYFVSMSDIIRKRRERRFQRKPQQVFQIDIVKDFAVPTVTRFVADFLGFGHLIKTEKFPNRKFDENEIYEHICNCQDFLIWNADETTIWKRRLAFRSSIKFLKELTEEGVREAQPSLLEALIGRSYGTYEDSDEVKALRKFSCEIARRLKAKTGKSEEVAAVMLFAGLDACHKSILIFTSVMEFLINRPQDWGAIQELAYRDNDEANSLIKRYVMEAQRINHDVPSVRQYIYKEDQQSISLNLFDSQEQRPQSLNPNDIVVMNIQKASQNPEYFPKPDQIDLKRPLARYLVYGHEPNAPFTIKRLTIIILTGLVKHAATLKRLRPAHEAQGRLKRVKTPIGREKYLNVQWDALLPFPATWQLRYDGVGQGVFDGPDNTDQGHGMDKVWQDQSLSAVGGTFHKDICAPMMPLAATNGHVNGH